MKQTKLESGFESFVNIGSGFFVSLMVWMFIVAPGINAGYFHPGPTQDSLIITGIFTVTSLIRSYLWRRFFNAGIHRFIHHKIGDLYARHSSKGA